MTLGPGQTPGGDARERDAVPITAWLTSPVRCRQGRTLRRPGRILDRLVQYADSMCACRESRGADAGAPVASGSWRAQSNFFWCFFFFQAEDGIRDYKVTGVQTCAL